MANGSKHPQHYIPGDYEIQIFSNGTIWKTLSLSILLDNHTENVAPGSYSFNNDQDDAAAGNDSDFSPLSLILLGLAIVIIARKKGESDE